MLSAEETRSGEKLHFSDISGGALEAGGIAGVDVRPAARNSTIADAVADADTLALFDRDGRGLGTCHRGGGQGGETRLDERFDLDGVAWDGEKFLFIWPLTSISGVMGIRTVTLRKLKAQSPEKSQRVLLFSRQKFASVSSAWLVPGS